MAELFFMWCGGVMSVVAVLGLIGWLVKPRLIEWLRVEVIEPMQTIKKQVTENHHSNPEPTVLDKLSDLTDSVAALGEDQKKTDRSVMALTSIVGNLDGKVGRVDTKLQRHLTWSKTTTDRINDRLDAVEQPTDEG